MGKAVGTVKRNPRRYYDRRGVLSELEEAPIEFALDEELRR
ncbi:MAG: hypothetical protein M5R38_13245 [Candidatus Methylomirabilis sp.]|nr:hypothetical protein [Candidatus Methylomirabilis sp.]